jgi:hypothetical protein
METWAVAYPIDFTIDGDTTAQAIYKALIQEIAKIYTHLNFLAARIGSSVAYDLAGEVETASQLPANPPRGTVYGLRGMTEYDLVVWDGTQWITVLTFSYADLEPGLARAGSLDRLVQKTLGEDVDLDPLGIITEALLADFAEATGQTVPRGSIVAWWGSPDAVPEGWHECNGLDGTPDFRGKFLRGGGDTLEQGGVDEHSFTELAMQNHGHTFDLNVGSGRHRHTVSGMSGSSSATHTHNTSYASIRHGNVGNHDHYGTPGVAPMGAQYQYLRQYPFGATGNGPQWRDGNNLQYSTTTDGAHNHTYSASGGTATLYNTHSHTVSGSVSSAGSANITLKGTTSAAKAEGTTVIDNRPAYAEMLYIIKL